MSYHPSSTTLGKWQWQLVQNPACPTTGCQGEAGMEEKCFKLSNIKDKKNIIFLTDLNLFTEITISQKKSIINKLALIANLANNNYINNNMNIRVSIIDYLPCANELDATCVFATIGDEKQLEDFDFWYSNMGKEHNNDSKYDYVGVYNGIDQSTLYGCFGGDKGNRIAINRNSAKQYSNLFKISEDDLIAWAIRHGSGHNAGIGHSDAIGYQGCGLITKDGRFNLMTSGETASLDINSWKKYRNIIGEDLKKLFYKKGKFDLNVIFND